MTDSEPGILLIDDDTMILEVGAEMLNVLGYPVLKAANGYEGLSSYKHNRGRIGLTMRHHHSPSGIPKGCRRLAYILYVSDFACQERGIMFCDDPYSHDPGLMRRCLRHLDIEPNAVELILEDMAEKISAIDKQGLLG